MKYYTNTPTEQMLLNTAEGSNILNFDDLATALPDLGKQRVARALSSLNRKGALWRLRRGLYLRCEPPYGPVIENPERLALEVYPGYIGFSTALAHWGLLEYEPFTVFVVTDSRSGETEVGAYLIKAVSMGERARGMVFDSGVYVSGLEKTIFDCIYKPVHAGGYPTLARAISDADPDWDRLYLWFERLASPSLKQRAAFVLSKTSNAPTGLCKRLVKGATSKVWLDPSGPRSGKYDAEWMVMDNVGGWY
jgi:predicted transcriptional regulator of viral defense system